VRALLATVLLLALPATASAARVERTCGPLVPSIDCPVPPLTVTAAPGERNALTLSLDGNDIVVRDAGAPPTAGAGCRQAAADTVRCEALVAGQEVTVAAGDGNDGIDAGALRAGQVTLEGGPGNDFVAGGDGRDVIQGGEGADVLLGAGGNDFLTGDRGDALFDDALDGGPGRDTAAYEERTRPLTVDLGDPAPDGSPGEADRLTTIENVVSGSGDTVLRGDDGPNALAGPYGGARVISSVTGRGGDDRLTGGEVDGGPGDDVVSGRRRARCGTGVDRLFDPRLLAPVPPRDCERIDLDGLVVGVRDVRVRRGAVTLTAERTERGRGTIMIRFGRRTAGRVRVPAASGPRRVTIRVRRGRGAPAVWFDPAAYGVPTRGFAFRAAVG
jgi:hypothetical protein